MPGSPCNLEDLYNAHAQALFGFVMNLTRDPAGTQDVLQDIFCRLAEKPALLAGVKDPRAYLMQMAYRKVVDSSRRKAVRERFAEEARQDLQLFESSGPEQREFREAVEHALSALPHDQRAAIHLKLWEHMTYDQIATALDISPNTAASRCRYALDKLRTLLRPTYEERK